MNTEKVAERLQEIMDLADMHAHARIMPGTPRENLPYCILRALVQAALAEIETLRSGYAASRLEIESMRAQRKEQQAQNMRYEAKVLDLERLLESVGAGGVGPLLPTKQGDLQCDYCGAVTDDPWHSSGMLNGKLSKHIHSCDACAQDPTQQGGIP